MLSKQSSNKRRNKSTTNIECLEVNDEDNGFIDGEVDAGEVLSTFSFGMAEAPSENKTSSFNFTAQDKSNEIKNVQNLTFTSSPRGLTPPINGENFTVKRSYAMRPSTVRKLNELKAKHPDVNMLFNTIVDMAVSHYYNYIINEGGDFNINEEKKKPS